MAASPSPPCYLIMKCHEKQDVTSAPRLSFFGSELSVSTASSIFGLGPRGTGRSHERPLKMEGMGYRKISL